ncbi:MAG: exonuclease VII small subunit [Pelagibacteraceae bacterium]
MKSKNILGDVKSKSLKEAKDEINKILSKFEKNDVDLEAYRNDYNRLLQLNNHVDALFKNKVKEISVLNKKKD